MTTSSAVRRRWSGRSGRSSTPPWPRSPAWRPTPARAISCSCAYPRPPAGEAEAFLAGRGVLVRGLANYGLDDSLRITVGLPEQNAQVVEGLRTFLAG